MPFTVAAPMRIPVKLPGPMPTVQWVMSASAIPVASRCWRMSGSNFEESRPVQRDSNVVRIVFVAESAITIDAVGDEVSRAAEYIEEEALITRPGWQLSRYRVSAPSDQFRDCGFRRVYSGFCSPSSGALEYKSRGSSRGIPLVAPIPSPAE
jgi:hypothetical protein